MTRTVALMLSLCVCSLLACGDDSEDAKDDDAGQAKDAGSVGADDAGGADPVPLKPVAVDRSKLMDVGVADPLDYANNALWMCRPDNDPNECARDLTMTELKPDG